MKTEAGSGFTWIRTDEVNVVTQQLPFSPSPDAQATFTTPSGVWTRLRSVFVNVDPTGAAGTNYLRITAFKGTLPLFIVTNTTGYAAVGTGNMTLALGLNNGESDDGQSNFASLPDIWLPPQTLVQFQWDGFDAVGTVTNASLTYECAKNITV